MATVSSSDLGPQLDELADRIIASYEHDDADAYLRLFAPGATVWLSYLGAETSAEQSAALLTEIFEGFVSEFRYDDMRRQRTATGYLQQCELTIVAKSGATLAVPICTVARVTEDGRIARLEEYLDSSIVSFGQAQQQAPTRR